MLDERCKLRKERFPGIQSINSLQEKGTVKRWVRVKNLHVIFPKDKEDSYFKTLGRIGSTGDVSINTPEWLKQWGLSAVTVAWNLQCLGLNRIKAGREAPGCETFCFPAMQRVSGKKKSVIKKTRRLIIEW